MSQDATRKRTWYRFSLATFLFASLCIGGLIAGYESGYRSGYQGGKAALYDTTQVVESYDCSSLLWSDRSSDGQLEDLNKLVKLIQDTISPDLSTSPTSEIRVFPSNQSLVISTQGSVHREIRELFAQLEKLTNRKLTEPLGLVPTLQQFVSVGESRAVAYPFELPSDSRRATQWLERVYRTAADEVSQSWGRPRFDGECTDKRFPQWSTDQKLVSWKRQNGVAIVSLRYLEDGKLYFMTGFQKDG